MGTQFNVAAIHLMAWTSYQRSSIKSELCANLNYALAKWIADDRPGHKAFQMMIFIC